MLNIVKVLIISKLDHLTLINNSISGYKKIKKSGKIKFFLRIFKIFKNLTGIIFGTVSIHTFGIFHIFIKRVMLK